MFALLNDARRSAAIAFCCLAGCGTGAVPSDVASLGAFAEASGERASADVTAVVKNEGGSPPQAPDWAAEAVFYQIFPERFRNGDLNNDPTRDSLEFPEHVPESWQPSPWTGDWYARADWERKSGDNFFEHGVFNRRYGGDLQGVIDKLDYLQDLGVTAIYFNPVFYGRSLHKYDSGALHHVDPHFGPDPVGDFRKMAGEAADPNSWKWTAADRLFLQLLRKAHKHGIRVIIDGAFNHTGRDFFAFADVAKNGERSPYADWYIVAHFDDPQTPANEFQYRGWWGNATLPEFADNAAGNDMHHGPKEYVMNVTQRWMDPNGDGNPEDGVDGWRLDVAEEVPLPFWKEWNARVRELNPDAYTVAELWSDARRLVVGGGFSSTMNYHAFAFPVKGYLIDGAMTPHDFGQELQRRRKVFPPAIQRAALNLVDSHDTDRLASMIVNRPVDASYRNPERFDFDEGSMVSPRYNSAYQIRPPTEHERRLQRMIVLLQMTSVGAPMIYYGDEAGMWGGDDPCDRRPMVWDDLAHEPQSADPLGRPSASASLTFDAALHDFYRRAIKLRQARPELRRGTWEEAATDDAAKFFAFRRSLNGKTSIVAFNRGDQPYAWRIACKNPSQAKLAFATDDAATANRSRDGRGLEATLPPWSGLVISE